MTSIIDIVLRIINIAVLISGIKIIYDYRQKVVFDKKLIILLLTMGVMIVISELGVIIRNLWIEEILKLSSSLVYVYTAVQAIKPRKI